MQKIRLLLFFATVLATGKVCSQQLSDTAFVSAASANAEKAYEKFIMGQSRLYTGSEYKQPHRTNQDHPFYREFDWQEGTINYDGEHYINLSFLLDLSTDNLITEHFYNADEMVLVKAKIQRFTIAGHQFVNFRAKDLPSGLPVAGFYRLLYDGPSKVVGRYFKTPEDKIEGNKVERYYTLKTRFYLFRNGEYHKISNRGDLLKLFADKRQQVRSYASKEQLRVSRSNPESFARLAAYYDSLTPQNQ